MIDTTRNNTLGLGRIIGLGEVELTIGVERSQFAHGTDYHREPRGYVKLRTTARGKLRHDRPWTARDLRELARNLSEYADMLDAWQTADAIEAAHRAELAS